MIIQKKAKLANLKYIKEIMLDFPLYIISHPFKGFDEVKSLKRGNIYYSISILIIFGLVAVFRQLNTGFVVSNFFTDTPHINIFEVLLFTYSPILLFCIGNWSITSITDGKGTMKEIFLIYTYALYPLIFMMFIGTVASNFITLNEIAFVNFFFAFGQILFFFYLFVGLVMIHEYSFTRALSMVVLTILAMMIIIFVLSLATSLVSELISFFFTVSYELEAHF